MVFSDRYWERHCDTTSEIPDVDDEAFNSEATFTFVIADAPAVEAALAATGVIPRVSALDRHEVVMLNYL